MAQITVDNYTDVLIPGLINLRQAIAMLGAGGGTINFGSGTATVDLLTPLTITTDVTIIGGVSQGLTPTVTIAQVGAGNVITVAPGANVTLEGVAITGGNQRGAATASVEANGADGAKGGYSGSYHGYGTPQAGGTGQAGTTGSAGPTEAGGGIINGGVLTLIDDSVFGNTVVGAIGSRGGIGGNGGAGADGSGTGGNAAGGGDGGPGGNGAPGGAAEGGGIFNTGTLELIQTNVFGNSVIGGKGGAGGAGGNGGAGGTGATGFFNSNGFTGGYTTPGGAGGRSGNGGASGNGGNGGSASGGGIYNLGVVLVRSSTVAGNFMTGGAGGIEGTAGNQGYVTNSTYDALRGQWVYTYTGGNGGAGSPNGANGAFGVPGATGVSGTAGTFGGDVQTTGLVLSVGAISLSVLANQGVAISGLTVSDPNTVTVTVSDTLGSLYLSASGGTNGKTLTFSGLAATVTQSLSSLHYVGIGQGVDTITITASDLAHTVSSAISMSVTCFLAGTCIATPRGERAVEQLAIGDLVRTASGEARPITWIGIGHGRTRRGHRDAATPVILRKGALADNVPHRDLHVTKAHAVHVDGVLIPVEFLVNHRSIIWDDHAQDLTIYHIELESHDILLANGAPAESYRDDGNRWLFDNANSSWDSRPEPPCFPVLTGGPVVDAAWRRLLDRAGPRPGIPLTADPDLHLLVDGQRLDAEPGVGDERVFTLPSRRLSVRVVSRAGAPAECGVARDPRMLGVALRQMTLRQGERARVLIASDPSLSSGYHPFEADCGLRWTDGDAELPSALFAGFDGPARLVLRVGCTTQYPMFS